MTCIVGVETTDSVYIGGDIQGTGWNSKVIHTQPKVFKKGGVVFGYTTSYRFGQLIEHSVPDPVVPEDDDQVYRWLVMTLIPSIKDTLKDAGWDEGGQCLIGIKNQLWELQGDWSVLRSTNGYKSVGSGTEYATGSLFTSFNGGLYKRTRKDDVVAAIELAIKSAGTFSPSVGEEATVISTK
jgi:ATP-dependent protease HslVU (ClpYQ) peptidase subunit